jgi:hypothetical protein
MAYHNLSLTGAQLDAKLGRIDDSIQTIASASGATELDYADASVFDVTATGDVTLSYANLPAVGDVSGRKITINATDIELRDPS